MYLLISVVIYLSLSYTCALFIASRRRRALPLPAPADLFFVFVVPCLNEEKVIGQSLERLFGMTGNFAVLVIDDGSEDATSSIVLASRDPRVHLLKREAPNARQGKGRALNAAYRYLLGSEILEGRRPEDVVLVVVDADGRISPNALTEVAPYFRDPKVGAVQIGVRMYNAEDRLLARMQDLEFITYTEIFQRARQRLGSVGLGGNGQFTRLAALRSLGDEPWSDCLTEDLDLGLRLLANGWINSFCPTTRVSQQAVTKLRPLIRQRTRWFQGHLQTWKRIPLILRSNLPLKTVLDLVNVIINPGLVLATSLMVPVLMSALLVVIVAAPLGFLHALLSGWGINIFFWYLLTFGLAPFYAFAYWMQEERISFPRALAYAHAYNVYGYMWFLAGWRAVSRIVLRRSSWAKTARVGEAPAVVAPAADTHGPVPVVVDLRDETSPPADEPVAALAPAPIAAIVPAPIAAMAAEPVAAAEDEAETPAFDPGPLHRRRLVFGAGVPVSVVVLAAVAGLIASHSGGSGWSGPRFGGISAAPVRDAVAVAEFVALKSRDKDAPEPTAVAADAPNGDSVAAPSAIPPAPVTTSHPTTTSTALPGVRPGAAPNVAPPVHGPTATNTPAPGPASSGPKPAPTPAPSCPSGQLVWSAHSTDQQAGAPGSWSVAVTGTIQNQTSAAVRLDSVVAHVSYHRADGSLASADVSVSPASTTVGPSATTSFDGSTTLQSTDPPQIAGLTISSHWVSPAYSSCATAR